MAQTRPDDTDRWLTRQELRELFFIGIPNMTIRKWEQRASFPRRQKREEGGRWSERDIRRWLAETGWRLGCATLCIGLLALAASAWAIDDVPQHHIIVGSPDTGFYQSSDGTHLQVYDQGLGSATYFSTDRDGHTTSGTIFYSPGYAPIPPVGAAPWTPPPPVSLGRSEPLRGPAPGQSLRDWQP